MKILRKHFSNTNIVGLVRKGVISFETNRVTCLAPDWSQEGIGFLLLQLHCIYPTKKVPVCCPGRWRICKQQILYQCRALMCTHWRWNICNCLGIRKILHIYLGLTDHQLLMGIFGDWDLSEIDKSHLFKLKEESLRYFITIQNCPGMWHKGADAISCNPVATVEALLSLCPTHHSSKDVHSLDNIDAAMESVTIQLMMNSGNNNTAMSPDHIHTLGWNDQSYMTLIDAINQRFPFKHSLKEPEICDFWEV